MEQKKPACFRIDRNITGVNGENKGMWTSAA